MANDAKMLFVDRYNTVKPSWDQRKERYRRNYEQILAKQQAGPYNSRIATKYTHSQVMVWNSFAIAGLLPTFPWVYCNAKEPFRQYPGLDPDGNPVPIDIESAATEEFNARLKEMEFYSQVNLWLRVAPIYGLGIGKLTWDGGVNFGLSDPANMAWDPTARHFRGDAQYVIERYDRLTVGQIKALIAEGRFLPGILKSLDALAVDEESERAKRKRDRLLEDEPEGLGDDRRVTLHDLVTRDRIITFHAEAEIVVGDIVNPYGRIYYYDLTPFPEAFEIQGWSLCELLEGIQREMNTLRQQRTDIRSLEANPMLKIKRSSGINIRGQRSRPGKIWPVQTQDDVGILQFQDTGFPLLQEEMGLIGEGDRLLGILAHTRGERGEAMKATVANLLHTNVGTRFAVSMSRMQDYPFRPLLADFVELCGWYDTPTRATPVEWKLIQDAIRQRGLEVVLHPESHVGNPFAKIQLYAQLLQMAQQDLMPEGRAVIIKEALKLAQMPDVEKVMQHIIPFAQQLQMAQTGRGKADQGQGVAMTGEMARARAPGQAAAPVGIPT